MNSAKKIDRRGGFAAWGAVLVAVVSSACCWLPLLLLVLGLSGGAVAARFESLRPVLVPVTFVLLALGWYFTLRPRSAAECGTCAPTDGEGEASCPTPRSGRLTGQKFNLIMLTAATLMATAFAFFPDYLGAIVTVGTRPDTLSGPVLAQTVVLGIEGMTCAGCEVPVAKGLETVAGVVVTSVDHGAGRATVQVPVGTDHQLLREAVARAGYLVTGVEAQLEK